MTITQNISAVVAGRFTTVEFKKDYKTRNGAQVTKITKGVYRLGISAESLVNYEHKGNGLQGEQKWIAYPYLMEGKNGLKIRLYATYNPFQRAKSHYLVTINGQTRPTTKEEALKNGWLVPSEVKPREGVVHMFDVMLDNIIRIG